MNDAATTTTETSDLLAEIQADSYTDVQLDKVGQLHDTFAYTSTMLAAMADHLAGLGDSKAHMMLLGMAEQMAKHEAEVA